MGILLFEKSNNNIQSWKFKSTTFCSRGTLKTQTFSNTNDTNLQSIDACDFGRTIVKAWRSFDECAMQKLNDYYDESVKRIFATEASGGSRRTLNYDSSASKPLTNALSLHSHLRPSFSGSRQSTRKGSIVVTLDLAVKLDDSMDKRIEAAAGCGNAAIEFCCFRGIQLSGCSEVAIYKASINCRPRELYDKRAT